MHGFSGMLHLSRPCVRSSVHAAAVLLNLTDDYFARSLVANIKFFLTVINREAKEEGSRGPPE